MPINSFLYPAKNVPGAYEVANSCRFNIGDDAKLTRTAPNSSATHDDKFTFSCWVKRSVLGARQQIYSTYDGGGSPYQEFQFYFKDTDELRIQTYNSSNQMELIPTRLFRDPTSWMHFVFAYDSSQGTASNRGKLYVNGVQETSFSTETYPSQNVDGEFAIQNHIQAIGNNTDNNRDSGMYLAEMVGVDGQALAPTEFGEFDEDSPTIWKPKDVSGINVGTLGFYLDFEDSSALGNDVSGVGDFTVSNLVAADQATDTCTNNFCTVNPLDQYGSYTLSEGNCQITSGHTSWYTIGSTMAVSNGKWYYEVEFDAGTMIEIFVGVHDTSVNRTDTNAWLTGSSLFYNDAGGEIRTDGTNSTADYGTLSAGDILGIALNMDDKQITLYKNGSAIASNVALSTSISEAMPTFLTDSNDVVFKVNFGGCPSFAISSGNADGNGYGNFEYSVPSNYYSLCTKNLAEYGG